jgi:hypothetical protein
VDFERAVQKVGTTQTWALLIPAASGAMEDALVKVVTVLG